MAAMYMHQCTNITSTCAEIILHLENTFILHVQVCGTVKWMLKAIKLFLLDRIGRKGMDKFVWFYY